MNPTQLSANGLQFIADNEGEVLHPYRDSAGIPTIGIGMTYYPDTGKAVTMQDEPITQERSRELFALMVKPREHTVSAFVTASINQNQYDSLVDFEYNTGHLKGSTLLERVNNGGDIAEAFLMWDKITVNGVHVESEGLKERRLKEIAVYNS